MSIIGKQYMGRVNLVEEAQIVDNNPTTVVTRDAVTGDVKLTPASFFATDADLNNKADLVDGKVPASQLPSYVDDVLEYADLASFPITGENGKIYIALDTNKTYRWSGTVYVEISASLALGETSSTAYRGDRGKIAYDHSQTIGNPHNTQIGDISGLQTALNEKAIDADVIHKNNTTEAKQGILLAGALISQNESSDNKISLQASLAVPNIQFSNFADTVGKAGKINGSGGILGIGKNPRTGFMLDVLNTLGADKIIVSSDTDTGEAVQFTGQLKFDLYNLSNSTPGITIYTKSSPADPSALRVVNKDTDELLIYLSKNGTVFGKNITGQNYLRAPKIIIRPGGEPETGEQLQVDGDGIIEGGLKVATAPVNPTDVVRLQDLANNVKKTGESFQTIDGSIGVGQPASSPFSIVAGASKFSGTVKGANATVDDEFTTLGQLKGLSDVDNTTTTPQTAASLNSAYPSVGVGFRAVYSAIGDGMVYIKTTEAGEWIGTPTFKLTP